MNIPIVQGTAVPSGDGDMTQQAIYTNHNTPYMATNDGHSTPFMATNDGNVTEFKAEVQPKQFRDVPWAVLFWLHLAAMIVIIAMNMSAMEDGGDFSAYNGVIWMVGVTAVASIGIGSFSMGLMMRYPTELVKVSLVFSVLMSLLVGILGFMAGQMLMGGLGLVMFFIGICYAKMVWPRIPFAAANLNTALTAVKANMGLTVVSYFSLLLALGWSMLWFIGLGEAVSSSNGITLFLLFLSYYWVHQVLTNTVHVTTAGTIGTWWFVPDEANSCWSSAIQDSFCRATTYSFGSICFGSLLVAIVQALRALNHMSRNNEDMQMLTCIIDCILGCIEDIIEYLNKWAYVYVGLYGFGYLEAGRNVIQLFEQKGWTVIISDDLCDRVLFMVSVGVGLLTGLIGLALAAADGNLLAGLDLGGSDATAGFV
jgi:hypothetical protein